MCVAWVEFPEARECLFLLVLNLQLTQHWSDGGLCLGKKTFFA